MEFLDYPYIMNSKNEELIIHFIGDTHIGAKNCLEDFLRERVKFIKKNKNIRVILMGDIIDGVVSQDKKRFDIRDAPDWVFDKAKKKSGDYDWDKVREALSVFCELQIERAIEILKPIRKQIIGIISGNHEISIRKYFGYCPTRRMANELDIKNLSDCAIVRINFKCVSSKSKEITNNNSKGKTVTIWCEHGSSGGNGTALGSEENALGKILLKSDCNVSVRGHSHKAAVTRPISFLTTVRNKIGDKYESKEKVTFKERYAGNSGSYLFAYDIGFDSYPTRAGYLPLTLRGLKLSLKPFSKSGLKINLSLIPLDGKE